MKLTQPDLKIKCKLAHLKSLCEYLTEIVNNHDDYLKPFVNPSTLRRIYRHNLATILEKTAKLIFNHINEPNKNLTLKFNEAERMTFFSVSAYYPLPLDINFIEYETKKGLLK